MMSSLWIGWLLIFFARVCDMSLDAIRTLFLVRGRSWQAGLIGFFEALIYIIALKLVFQHLDTVGSFFFYASGFAFGNLLGSYLEGKMAIGFLVVQIIPKQGAGELVEQLRKSGFGVTIWTGEGLEGEHEILNLVIRRKDNLKLLDLVKDCDPCAFISISEARAKEGGVFGLRQTK
jgi:uncharacterized protein YebE (UPF0316 family)